MKSIYRYEVPIGVPVVLWVGGDPVHVALCWQKDGEPRGVEFWAEVDMPHAAGSYEGRTRERVFAVVGTGHSVPSTAKYWGTTPRTPEGFVWHLYEFEPRGKTRSGIDLNHESQQVESDGKNRSGAADAVGARKQVVINMIKNPPVV